MTKTDRKLILVRSDLLQRALSITAKEGRTLFSLTNEIFEQAIEAHDLRVTLAESLEFYNMMRTGKSLGFLAIPSDIFNHMAQRLYAMEGEELLNIWYEHGLWNGNYLATRFHDKNPLGVMQSFMKASLWNLDEFFVNTTKEGGVEVKCFSSNLNLECVKMLAKFLHGVFNSLGYTVKGNKCFRGIIMMELENTNKTETKPKQQLKIET